MPQTPPRRTLGRRPRRSRAALSTVGALALAGTLAGTTGGASADLLSLAPPSLTYVTGLASSHPTAWIASVTGRSPRRLGAALDARLSPDGLTVALLRQTSGGGYAVATRPSATGAATHTLLTGKDDVQLIGFSPDSEHLLAVVDENRLVVGDVATGRAAVVARGYIDGASFAPDGAHIAYARSATQQLSARVDVWTANLDGSDARAITHDGRSLEPLWGPTRIAYSHERLRPQDAPVFQLWTMSPSGSGRRQLTHVPVPTLVSGLVATQWSSDGTRLLAEFGGQDTSRAYAVDARTGAAKDIAGRDGVRIGVALSGNGRTVLAQDGSFEDPEHQSVITMSFGGGGTKVLVRHGSSPSWNR